jgi:Tripartite tricarboxylate transporter TctB family
LRLHEARKDLLAGGTFSAFGLAFAITASTYEVGSPLRMGPGFFPLVLGSVLVLLGILIAVKGFVAGVADDIGAAPWRSMALLVAAILFFGFTVRGLGLVPALLVTVLLSALAGHHTGVIPAAVIAGCLTVLCVLIFVVGLQLRLPLFGPWLPG